MKLPSGILKEIANEIESNISYVSAIIGRHQGISKKKACELEKACKKLGYDITKELWVFGASEDIKERLLCKKLNTN